MKNGMQLSKYRYIFHNLDTDLQVKLCDPRLSALSVVATIQALYKYTSFPFFLFPLIHVVLLVLVLKLRAKISDVMPRPRPVYTGIEYFQDPKYLGHIKACTQSVRLTSWMRLSRKGTIPAAKLNEDRCSGSTFCSV